MTEIRATPPWRACLRGGCSARRSAPNWALRATLGILARTVARGYVGGRTCPGLEGRGVLGPRGNQEAYNASKARD